MLSNIYRDIDILRQSHIKKGEKIDALIRQVQGLNNKIASLSQQVEQELLNKQLSKLTKNQMIVIGSFLEFKQFIRLRLVNRQFRNLVQSCFPDLKITYQNKLNIVQQELNGLQENNALTIEQVQQRLNQLNKQQLHEVLAFARPPQLVFDVLSAAYILIVGHKSNQNIKFDEIKPKLKSQDSIQTLLNVRVENLNAYQMSVLESITHSVQQAQHISIATSYFLDFLLGIKELAQSPSFIRKQQIKRIQQNIKVLDKY
ncbi:hypothetical protein pb186bvf_001726 [Paramecium bursaria]